VRIGDAVDIDLRHPAIGRHPRFLASGIARIRYLSDVQINIAVRPDRHRVGVEDMPPPRGFQRALANQASGSAVERLKESPGMRMVAMRHIGEVFSNQDLRKYLNRYSARTLFIVLVRYPTSQHAATVDGS